ncbi:hypothetical protein SOVF_096060 isoform B [Spinacia oleracea]|nr:hypothetical protein SOVF_096060 isoform B [Spinacia oleracea]
MDIRTRQCLLNALPGKAGKRMDTLTVAEKTGDILCFSHPVCCVSI